MNVTSEPKTRFYDLLKEENILCHFSATTPEEAIIQLVELLHKNEDGFDKESAIQVAIRREQVSPTVVAPGLALPHARIDDVETPLVAIGTSSRGIDYRAPDERPVKVVVLTLTLRSDPDIYLQVLSTLVQNLQGEHSPQRLSTYASAKEIYGSFAHHAAQHVDDLPPYLLARDFMDMHPVTLLETDTLEGAVNIFSSNPECDIPVVDEEGDFRGVLSLEDLLRLTLPEHLLWLENPKPIIHFEPFGDVLSKERETKVADFMREECPTVSPNIPAILLAKMFLVEGVRQILVVDGQKLVGAVNLHTFLTQLFWA